MNVSHSPSELDKYGALPAETSNVFNVFSPLQFSRDCKCASCCTRTISSRKYYTKSDALTRATQQPLPWLSI